jgi:hypothetical protein
VTRGDLMFVGLNDEKAERFKILAHYLFID